MKAWKARDNEALENWETVVFAETASEAKMIAMSTDCCEEAQYIDIRVNRVKKLDECYRGEPEMDWYNDQDRLAMILAGWRCDETSDDCENCIGRDECEHWEEEEEE